MSVLRRRSKKNNGVAPVLGTCPVREHTADGVYVGRCCFATHDGVCPRHGLIPNDPKLQDDRLIDRPEKAR